MFPRSLSQAFFRVFHLHHCLLSWSYAPLADVSFVDVFVLAGETKKKKRRGRCIGAHIYGCIRFSATEYREDFGKEAAAQCALRARNSFVFCALGLHPRTWGDEASERWDVKSRMGSRANFYFWAELTVPKCDHSSIMKVSAFHGNSKLFRQYYLQVITTHVA